MGGLLFLLLWEKQREGWRGSLWGGRYIVGMREMGIDGLNDSLIFFYRVIKGIGNYMGSCYFCIKIVLRWL